MPKGLSIYNAFICWQLYKQHQGLLLLWKSVNMVLWYKKSYLYSEGFIVDFFLMQW